MKKLLLLTPLLCFATPARAQETPTASSAPLAVAPSGSWLDERGLISLDALLESLGAKVTPEQRSDIEKALNERNAVVANANAKLSGVLKKSLATDDTKLANTNKEAIRLDRIRRLQPSRYQEIMRRKAEAEKAEAEKVNVEQK